MRARPHAPWLALAVLSVAVAAGCDTDPAVTVQAPATREVPSTTPSSPDATGEQTGDATVGSIEWQPVTERVDAGWLTVPVDYADPDGPTIDLRVAIHRADEDDRIGVLFSNNGGPGAPASTIALNANAWFASDIVERFDIVSWDPRGAGQSAGVDCIDGDQYDHFFASTDITPETPADHDARVALAEEYADLCLEASGDILEHIGTNNTARDMDTLRQVLGEPQASFFGFSYGSELGAVWATMFPNTVRAAVLDGAADPDADPVESNRLQYVGFENALATFLAECSADTGCDFHSDGDAEGAFDDLFAALDDEPLAAAGERTPVTQEVMQSGVIQAMYNDLYWPSLATALAEARAGDGNGLLALHDEYYQRNGDGTYSDLLESFQAISCADEPERLTVAEADAAAEQLEGVAPRLFPQPLGDYSCTFFPAPSEERTPVTGVGAGPIVVIGTTGDPATPLESSERMADSLEDGRLVIVEANQHTGYGANECVMDVVHDYLIQLIAPEDDTVCG